MREIDDVGGIISAIESKWVDTRLEQAAFKSQGEIRTGKSVKVGVNFAQLDDDEQETIEVHRMPPGSTEEQLERTKMLRAKRNNGAVRKSLLKLRDHAGSDRDENLIPFIVECVEAYATIGEIFGTINQAFNHPYDSMGVIRPLFEE